MHGGVLQTDVRPRLHRPAGSRRAGQLPADDGKFYKDPTIRGEFFGRKWFICFDDDDPPELVAEEGLKHCAAAILASVGIVASHGAMGYRSLRCFDGDLQNFLPAVRCFLRIKNRIPAALMPVPPEDTWMGALEHPGWELPDDGPEILPRY